ncbi:substrate-binding domain-containing protein [Microcoleus sp. D3_18a_C4]|uniref:substrate-binding domain-containing protein n=1 Tax=Microcoleus sp. D3_18a_C4 TaxID=3055332 RepID=UPI002FCF6C38
MTLPKFQPKVPRRTLEEIKRQGKWTLGSRLSYATYYLRYGIYNIVPPPLRWFVPFIQEDIKDLFRPDPEEETAPEEFPMTVAGESREEVTAEKLTIYEKYRCPFNNPLNCQEAQQTVTENPKAKACRKCGFPALLPNLGEIQGKRGRYRIERLLNSRGIGRLYAGVQLIEDRPVIIKEYLLPKRYFNEKEAIQTQLNFESLGGLSLADGRLQNGRIADPIEAIADRDDSERCYLITKGNIDSYSTLSTYIARKGAMSPRQVRHLLNQVLQSLEYLHGQKFRLPNGQIQAGIAHGHLSLQSLLISPQEQLYFHDPQFLVYLCDLNLWEHLFEPPPKATLISTPAQDLKALGYVSFYLLAGNTAHDGRPLDPRYNQNWGNVDIALQLFLFRLLELDVPFASAAEARRALLNLPPEAELPDAGVETAIAPVPENKQQRYWWRWLLLFLALGLLGGLLAWWFSRRQVTVASSTIPTCCISDVPAVPNGKFTYAAEQKGIWNYILRQPNLIQKDKTLEAELLERRPQLQLNYRPQPTGKDAIAQVRLEQVDFAISSLTTNLSTDLKAKTFAYDGLVFYVPFSYEQRDRSLPKHLNGRISFKQIQQLYTGKIANWQQLGGPDLPVRLYIPPSAEAVGIFEQRVLRDEELIAQFRNLVQSQANSLVSRKNVPEVLQVPTISALRNALRDFENDQIGAIGFGAISQVFGQCSVYPLAVGDSTNNFVQPLVQDGGRPIDPATDLCNQKGGYRPNYQVFQSDRYPLAYPLAVIFRRDNRRAAIGDRFAEILKTQESQQLLTKTGIVPLPTNR